MSRPLATRPLDLAKITGVRCKCGKTVAVSLADAKRMRRRASKNRNNNPVRYYQCEYNVWHWTSQLIPPSKT